MATHSGSKTLKWSWTLPEGEDFLTPDQKSILDDEGAWRALSMAVGGDVEGELHYEMEDEGLSFHGWWSVSD